MMTMSSPFALAESTASLATAAESPPLWLVMHLTPILSACAASWSIAPALKVSAAAMTTEYPCSLRRYAILAEVVVFPVPFTPTTMMMTGESSDRSALTVLSKSQ